MNNSMVSDEISSPFEEEMALFAKIFTSKARKTLLMVSKEIAREKGT